MPGAFACACLLTQTAGAQSLKPSMKDQVKLGLRAAEEIRKKEKVLSENDPRVKLLREVGMRLLATLPEKERLEKPWKYSFDVIQNKEVNAFALPGGPVFFYTGLLSRLKTVDQIAGVLSHELTHVRKEHWARDYARGLEQNALITIGGMLLGVNPTLMQGASLFETFGLALPRSRRAETEADLVGFDMMVQAGYNPNGMVEVFKMLHETGPKKGPPEFMSTHPDEVHRIKKLEDMVSASGRAYPAPTRIPLDAVLPYRTLELRGFLIGN